jgi:hypothetical protein
MAREGGVKVTVRLADPFWWTKITLSVFSNHWVQRQWEGKSWTDINGITSKSIRLTEQHKIAITNGMIVTMECRHFKVKQFVASETHTYVWQIVASETYMFDKLSLQKLKCSTNCCFSNLNVSSNCRFCNLYVRQIVASAIYMFDKLSVLPFMSFGNMSFVNLK